MHPHTHVPSNRFPRINQVPAPDHSDPMAEVRRVQSVIDQAFESAGGAAAAKSLSLVSSDHFVGVKIINEIVVEYHFAHLFFCV